ncbi:MAG: hypothetical protein FWG54_05525 [Bacteroidetes bacterium]|nr:hypothetical protein [Bacteroidota bacterium]
MKTTNITQDPLSDFFALEWAASLHEELPISPDFSAAVLKKIEANRRKERLFYGGCIAIALVGIMAVVVFVYPGYQHFDVAKTGVKAFVAEIIRSISHLFRFPSTPNLLSVPLITYLSLLTVALLGVDGLIRKNREAHTVS